MDITKGQIKEIQMLVRAANRRLERAVGGQKDYIKSQIKVLTGSEKFSAKYKGLTSTQAQKKIEMLNKFMENKITKKKAWPAFKADAIRKSNIGITAQGYNLTDEELADILDQIEEGINEEFYRAVNLVHAEKIINRDKWEATSDKVAAVLNQKIEFQDALAQALRIDPNLNPGKKQLSKK